MQKFKFWFYLGVLVVICGISVHKLVAERLPPVDAFYSPEFVPHFRSPDEVMKDEDEKREPITNEDLEQFRRELRDMV